MKHSIRYKMTALIVVVMAAAMLLAGTYGSVFMEKYYKSTKRSSIKNVYQQLEKLTEEDPNLQNSDNIAEMDRVCEKAGVTLIMVDSSSISVYDYGAGKMLTDRWKDMIFGQNIGQRETPDVIEENDEYTIQSTVDKFSSNQYYELYSLLSTGNYVIIRMSVESFEESISIANHFYLWLGIMAIVFTTIVIIFVTSRYTKPLLQLADISKRMSHLDFNAKYTGNHKDELGVLGESMNEMSEKLETTISELKSANLELHKDIAQKEEVDEMHLFPMSPMN